MHRGWWGTPTTERAGDSHNNSSSKVAAAAAAAAAAARGGGQAPFGVSEGAVLCPRCQALWCVHELCIRVALVAP